MKRLLGFLLALLVAVAAATPCCTGDEHPGAVASTQKHDTRGGDDGCRCSPFFACATCPGFVSMEQPVTLVIPVVHHQPYFDYAVPDLSSTYVPTPWQPPRSA